MAISSSSVFAECISQEGDLDGNNFVDSNDLSWIKQNPSSFWENILKKDISQLSTFLASFSKNYGSSCNIFNVKEFGAAGDGKTNDGPALQKVLDSAAAEKGGGKVFLPAGTYLTSQMLIVRNETEIYGEGSKTILLRSNSESYGPWYGGKGNCEKNIGFKGRGLFMNSGYNCGNRNISLHDFVIDGSLVKSGPAAVAIAFSAVENTKIYNLQIKNVPQDAIFIRNGGVNTEIKNNVIDGFNMRWYNGAGVNLEMWQNGNMPATKEAPVVIEGNTFIIRGPNFCAEDRSKACFSDGECIQGCNAAAVMGINAPWVSGSNPPRMIIQNNVFEMSNGHTAISCVGCQDSEITSNTIKPLPPSSATQPPYAPPTLEGQFIGITLGSGTQNNYVKNINIMKNVITGSGKPNDGRGILVSGNYLEARNIKVEENSISKKNLVQNLAALEVRGIHDFRLFKNSISEISNGHGLVVGSCAAGWGETTGGIVDGNVISIAEGVWRPIVLRRALGMEINDFNHEASGRSIVGEKGLQVQC